VLTLSAAVVAERLGPPPADLAPTLGHALAGSSDRAKARRIGIAEDKDHAAEKREHELRPAFRPVRLLGRDIRPTATEAEGVAGGGQGRGGRLAEVRAAMEAAAPRIRGENPKPPEKPQEYWSRGGGDVCQASA
jgi:hypothetical protein